MKLLTPNDLQLGAQVMKKALSYEKFCLRNYYQALSQADSGDKAVWERLIDETQAQVKLITEALQVRYGLG